MIEENEEVNQEEEKEEKTTTNETVENSSQVLEIYMRELKKFPVLTRKEETKVATKLQKSKRDLITLCINSDDCLTNIFLLSNTKAAHLRRLLQPQLEKDTPKEDVLKLAEDLRTLISNKLKGKKITPVLTEFLQNMCFYSEELINITNPLKDAKESIKLNYEKSLLELKSSKTRLTECNLKLVFSIVKKYQNQGLTLSELNQEGNDGLLKAIEKFDISRGNKFSTYATNWIRQTCKRAIDNKGHSIRIPVYLQDEMKKVSKKVNQEIIKLGRPLKSKELNAILKTFKKITPTIYHQFQQIKAIPKYLEDPIAHEGGTLSEFIADTNTPDPYEVLEAKETYYKIRGMLAKLEPRQEKVIRMRFGIGEKAWGQTLDEIGKEFKVSRERIRQIETKALTELSQYSKVRLREYL